MNEHEVTISGLEKEPKTEGLDQVIDYLERADNLLERIPLEEDKGFQRVIELIQSIADTLDKRFLEIHGVERSPDED